MSSRNQSDDVTTENSDNVRRNSYKRVVVKVGTGLLTDVDDQLNRSLMADLVEQISRLRAVDIDIILVSSGAMASGRHILGVPRRGPDVPFRQVLAAVGQGHLIHAYQQLFDKYNIPVAQALLSRRDLSDRLGYLNIRNTLLSLLGLGVVPVVNENDVVASEELAGEFFGDNDNLSAMVANIVDAEFLVMLGEVDGLFTADPHVDSNAYLIDEVEQLDNHIESMAGVSWGGTGQGGMVTKLEAAKLATASGTDVVIASGLEKDVIARLMNGKEKIGTFFPATTTRMESRKRWMMSGLSTKDAIFVDGGACSALINHHSSLLPAGVSTVEGAFERGEIVSVLDSKRTQIAVGITNYNFEELNKIQGMQSKSIQEVLGHNFGDEIIHRNNMVLLK